MAFNPITGKLDCVGTTGGPISLSTTTPGATNYIFSQNFYQTNAAYFVSSGTVLYNLSVGSGTVNDFMDFIGTIQPASPVAGTARIHATTFHGFTRIEEDNEAATNVIYGRDNVFIAKNVNAGTLSPLQVVYLNGSTGNVPNVDLALSSTATKLPAIGVVVDSISANGFGQIMKLGVISNVNTTSFNVSDAVYVSTLVAGGLTNIRPAVPNYVQRIGSVLLSGNGNGSILVTVAPFIGGRETGSNQTFNASVGLIVTTMTVTNLGSGVMHIVATSSNVVTSAVSLSSEVVGVLPLANMTPGASYYVQNTNSLQASTTFFVSSGSVAGQLTVSTGVFTGQLIGRGTITNDNALSFQIGYSSECSVGTATNISSTGTYFDLCSITIGPGDFMMDAIEDYGSNGATVTQIRLGFSATSGNDGTGLVFGDNVVSNGGMPSAATDTMAAIPPKRISLSASTTYYLKFFGNFTGGPAQVRGRLTSWKTR